jgi:hypothetical protein
MPMTPVYAAFFMGQGGYAFSLPFVAIAEQARARGIETDILPYTDYLRMRYPQGKRIAAVGYSLGVTAATYIQGFEKIDLLISIAASTLAENHLVNHTNTRRSVLYRGTDFLSSAGFHDGYDEVVNVTAGWGIPVVSHLALPTNPIVIAGVLTELAKLSAP